jgi:hypothetical protein
VIQPLIDEVQRLRAVMDDHQAYLAKTESATRYAVIDPVLKMLGWDVHDASAVLPEFRAGAATTTFVDYALLRVGSAVALVEAKPLGANLAARELEQLSSYCINGQPKSVRWGILTNGDRWQLVDAFRVHDPLPERVVMDFRVSEDSAIVALNRLVSLFGVVWGLAEQTAQACEPRVVAAPAPAVPPPALRGDEPLTALELRAGTGSGLPADLAFPDGTVVAVHRYAYLLLEVVRWLVASGRLTPERCPLPDAAGRRRNLVHNVPTHANGHAFHTVRPVGNGLLLETNYSTGNCCRNAVHALRACGVDPDSVRWRPLKD